MSAMLEAYLDIETTGLSWYYDYITVIGVYLVNERESKLVQLVGDQVREDNLRKTLQDVSSIYTYNGSRFDLPFIRNHLEVDLSETHAHRDLMYDCWHRNLKGGFKAVERLLGIPRQLTEVDGLEAVRLWWRYKNHEDEDALKVLLRYNEEDVVNLKALRERLSRL